MVDNIEFNVRVIDGDVYINDEFVSQLCWTNEAIAYAIGYWLDKQIDEKDDKQND